MIESIQVIRFLMERFQQEGVMHPVSYLFEDIYANDWGIASAAISQKRRGRAGPWRRELRFLVKRKRG
ncbi:hypothetical protein [Mesorhizobium sp. B2-6-2]|uniref:hypothetical protein n=1 Tax=Mesorhizobium sp. B2-6-2 TaxID=2589915 RepID=UPI00112E6BA7|nr:hypothetical protein [Mesorhizobium sp. B2-6-2]TPJ75632.1 hypothetical protein FJ419_20885 [Mesorhizobium sp. B2-6-2]